MKKQYRTKLTDAEYNAVMKLTANLKVDSVFDIYDCNIVDKFKDWETYRMVSLKTGFKWLSECMVYTLEHDGMTPDEAKLITDLMIEFDIMTPEQAEYYLQPDEE